MSADYPWFRFYDEALDEPKVQRLPAALFKYWINVLCLANRGTPRGALPPTEDVAFALRIDDDTAAKLLTELQRRELLEDQDGTLWPHHWGERQFKSDSSTARSTAWRRAKREQESMQHDATLHAALHDIENVKTGNVAGATPRNAIDQNRAEQIRAEGDAQAGAHEPDPATPAPTAKRSKPSGRTKTLLPEDFTLTDARRDYAIAKGLAPGAVALVFEHFQNHHRKEATMMADWDAGWRTWTIKQLDIDSRNGRVSAASMNAGGTGRLVV